jgi:hypothetical protein
LAAGGNSTPGEIFTSGEILLHRKMYCRGNSESMEKVIAEKYIDSRKVIVC